MADSDAWQVGAACLHPVTRSSGGPYFYRDQSYTVESKVIYMNTVTVPQLFVSISAQKKLHYSSALAWFVLDGMDSER